MSRDAAIAIAAFLGNAITVALGAKSFESSSG
jgi:hypothetical protein